MHADPYLRIDPPPLDFLTLQDPAQMRPVVEEIDGLLNLRFDMATVQSAMRVANPLALELEYTRTMMRCLLFNPSPRSMLMIGLGGGSLAKYCHQHLPQSDITVVEINPHVIALRDQFKVPPDGPGFRVLQADGAAYVQARAQGELGSLGHDVILVDAFHFDGAPAGIVSRRFFQACRSLLSSRGVLVMNLESDPEQCQPVLAQMGHAFGGAVWSVLTDASSNRIAFATSADHLMATMRQADARLAALPAVHRDTLTLRVANRLNFSPLFG
jgi:spermidine synthase